MNETIFSTICSRRIAGFVGATLLLSLAPALLASCTQLEGTDTNNQVLEARLELLETKEELRSMLLSFSRIVDTADLAALEGLAARLHPDFSLDVIDFDGGEFHFEGIEGLVEGYGPIMVSAQANLAVSAVAVAVTGDSATAFFKFINSVKPPPELGLDVDEKVLLLAANTATFVRENGVWKLKSLELVHSLAYPGALEGLGD